MQGYSLTETTCSGTCMEWGDSSVGKVGAPMAGMEVKLVDWSEGNYMVADTPRPRGEIIIGGPTVAKGSDIFYPFYPVIKLCNSILQDISKMISSPRRISSLRAARDGSGLVTSGSCSRTEHFGSLIERRIW